jgi:hypothetical protein
VIAAGVLADVLTGHGRQAASAGSVYKGTGTAQFTQSGYSKEAR